MRHACGGSKSADSGREMLKTLNLELDAAKEELRVLLGESKRVGAKQGTPIDRNAPPPQTPLEKFQAKLDRYNNSVETLKNSGILVQPVAIAVVAAAELHGRKLEESDYRMMDGIYGVGAALNLPLKVMNWQSQADAGGAGVSVEYDEH